MNIAVLSGKGGTGKTTISTNLAIGLNIGYVDSDVEEPNGFIFLEPDIKDTYKVEVEYPIINKNICNLCAECIEICQFNSLAKAGGEVVVFEKLCHDCGACKLVCKSNALDYKKRVIGSIEKGISENIECFRGVLNIGEPMAPPVIKALLNKLSGKDYLIDCPPGTSCNVVTALMYADAAVLVTEPSEFGLHDLKMAIELVKEYKIPYGIIINKDDGMENCVKKFCKENNIKLLGLLPYSMEAATLYSNGIMLSKDPSYGKYFDEMSENMREVFNWR